ncbi:MAG: hypoxanthine phosphoribosyltransferase [Proteobacteria bacterium]|jgi:hypoxanthine phosphoribosyltransferase|nr:hypoxanthine phosphoribosyltransferase [Pseudomonadota bacterium]
MGKTTRIEDFLSEEAIQTRVSALAAEIFAALPREAREQGVIMIGPLKGAVVFMADLARALSRLDLPLALDFLKLSSYGAGTVSSGEVVLDHDLSMDIGGRHVLLVDDIVDTGRTIDFAQKHLHQLNPASVTTALLLDKPSRRQVVVKVDHVGFEIPDRFVVGYGTDFDQLYRELPFVGVLHPRNPASQKLSGITGAKI